MAAEHLIDRGFRRLCIMTDQRHHHSIQAMQAFLQKAAEEEIYDCMVVQMDEESFESPTYWIKLEKLLSEKLKAFEPPIGVYIETAPHARLLVQLGQARGWHIPQDLAVLCQHNLSAVVDVSPQISRMEMNQELVGYKSAELLDQMLSGQPLPPLPIFVPPVGVIGRESTDYYAVSDSLVAEALRYISSRLQQKLRVDDIAYELAVSPSLLKKRFNASLGRGVGQEIRRLRLEIAKRMLIAPERTSISHIAKQAGFGSLDVLNQVFRRETGMTPSAYRNLTTRK